MTADLTRIAALPTTSGAMSAVRLEPRQRPRSAIPVPAPKRKRKQATRTDPAAALARAYAAMDHAETLLSVTPSLHVPSLHVPYIRKVRS